MDVEAGVNVWEQALGPGQLEPRGHELLGLELTDLGVYRLPRLGPGELLRAPVELGQRALQGGEPGPLDPGSLADGQLPGQPR